MRADREGPSRSVTIHHRGCLLEAAVCRRPLRGRLAVTAGPVVMVSGCSGWLEAWRHPRDHPHRPPGAQHQGSAGHRGDAPAAGCDPDGDRGADGDRSSQILRCVGRQVWIGNGQDGGAPQLPACSNVRPRVAVLCLRADRRGRHGRELGLVIARKAFTDTCAAMPGLARAKTLIEAQADEVLRRSG